MQPAEAVGVAGPAKARPFVRGGNVHVYPSPMRNETRIMKITKSLADAGIFDRIFLVGMADGEAPAREAVDRTRSVLRLGAPGSSGGGTAARALRILRWSVAVWREFARTEVACVNAHSLSTLPLCALLKLRHGARLVYDTHELETETRGSRGVRRWLSKAAERVLIRFADQVCVVNGAIADWYRAAYRLSAVHVVQNVPYRPAVPRARSGLLRDALGIGRDDLVFLYQGLIADGRGIDLLLHAFQAQPSTRHLVILGYGPRVDRVREVAARAPNVHYHPAVSPEVLADYTADADVGLSLIEDVSLSYRYCLPNKLFEYLFAGLPVVVSDLPCMREVVRSSDCGWVVGLDADQLATLLHRLAPDEIAARRRDARLVSERFGWDLEEASLWRMYDRLFPVSAPGGASAGAGARG